MGHRKKVSCPSFLFHRLPLSPHVPVLHVLRYSRWRGIAMAIGYSQDPLIALAASGPYRSLKDAR